MSRRYFDDDDDHIELDPVVKQTMRGPKGMAKKAKLTPEAEVRLPSKPAARSSGSPNLSALLDRLGGKSNSMPGSFQQTQGDEPSGTLGEDPYNDYNATQDARARRAKVCYSDVSICPDVYVC